MPSKYKLCDFGGKDNIQLFFTEAEKRIPLTIEVRSNVENTVITITPNADSTQNMFHYSPPVSIPMQLQFENWFNAYKEAIVHNWYVYGGWPLEANDPYTGGYVHFE